MKKMSLVIAIIIAVVSCVKNTIDDPGFTSIEKRGNEVILEGPVSSTDVMLKPVMCAEISPVSDTICINSIKDIIADDIHIQTKTLGESQIVSVIKNFFVKEKEINAELYLSYKNKEGALKKTSISFVFERQIPFLNEDNGRYYPISFETDMRFKGWTQNSLNEEYCNLKLEFNVILKEEKTEIGNFVLEKVFTVPNNQIFFDASVTNWENVSSEVNV